MSMTSLLFVGLRGVDRRLGSRRFCSGMSWFILDLLRQRGGKRRSRLLTLSMKLLGWDTRSLEGISFVPSRGVNGVLLGITI